MNRIKSGAIVATMGVVLGFSLTATAASAAPPTPAMSAPAAPTQAISATANAASSTAIPAALAVLAPLPIGSDPGAGFQRLPGHVLPATAKSLPIAAPAQAQRELFVTVVLKRDDQAGFDRYFHEVYDPVSVHYRHFLDQTQISDRFGPSRGTYATAVRYLRSQGLKVDELAANRLTLSAHGSRAVVEKAFRTTISDFRIGGQSYYANSTDPAVPAAIAPHVESVIGLSDYARPETRLGSLIQGVKDAHTCQDNNPITYAASAGQDYANIGCGIKALFFTIIYDLECIALDVTNLGLNNVFHYLPCKPVTSGNPGAARGSVRAHQQKNPAAVAAAVSFDGTGQKIGLLEFDSYHPSDVSDYLALIGAPPANIGNLTEQKVNGGAALGANEDEVLLDIDAVMAIAPAAAVKVYDAPFGGAGSFQALFNAMINDGVTVISNSWAYCEDQTTLADVQSIDAILKTAAASGISVFSGAGDSGSTCLDGSPSTIAVPADSPNVTAVGGTSVIAGPGYTYGSEAWWNGAASTPQTGQGGFGVSKFFAQPGYQASLAAATGRAVPDVVAGADPATSGLSICQADNGGCPNGLLSGGTSLSTPVWAAFAALLNQSQGKNLGLLNPLIYPLAGSAAFHSAASMGSDPAHVGLGSPNFSALNLALQGKTAGAVSATTSLVAVTPNDVAADGTSQANVVVRLTDSNGNAVSGKTVALTAAGGSATLTPASGTSDGNGNVVFTLTDLSVETLALTASDTTDGVTLTPAASLSFVAAPAASAGISANPATVAADGTTAATITVTLKDAKNRPTPGKLVTVSAAGAHAVITGPSPSVTDANGQIQYAATDQVNETVTFTAIDVTDDNLAVPGSGTVTYSGSTNTACGVGVAPVPGTGYTITPYITGLPAAPTLFYENTNIGCPGADNPTFTSSGNVLVADFLSGGVYQLGLAGGSASSANLLNTISPDLGTLVFGKDGNIYATLGGEGAEIVQVDAVTGAVARVLVSGLTCPAGLAVDPLSGDLFFDDQCYGGGTDDPTIYRIVDPANSDPNNPTAKVAYATLAATPNGGMAFAPNGTLFAVTGYTSGGNVEQVSGTNVATVAVTPLTGITSDYAIAIGATNTDGSAQSLIVEPAGVLNETPIANPTGAQVLASVSPGVGVVGPDGCLYSARYDTIYRLANAGGGCSFVPTSPAPTIKLSPGTVTPNPAQGGSQTFTATLNNVATAAGVPVTFLVSGVNRQSRLVDTDANGNAVLTYTGAFAGTDTVFAQATAGTASLASNTATLTWGAGKHVSFLTLNSSPQAGTANQAAAVSASLSDASVNPAVALSGQSIVFTLGTSTCTATTNSSGTASCQLTPPAVGSATLTVSFAGSTQFTAATAAVAFTVSAAVAPPANPPTVTLAVSPTNIAVGSPATLTWSSTNATACAASGAWSGTETTSGSQTVTPTAVGSYSYVLTCTGAGGSSAATAVLSATLVSVHVTAHSGGGAFDGYLLLALTALLLLRWRTATSAWPARPVASRRLRAALLAGLTMAATLPMARADDSAVDLGANAFDHLYGGVRVGSMPIRQDSTRVDQGLADAGFDGVTAHGDTRAAAGTVFAGYEFTPHAAVEVGYTYRSSNVATLNGTIASGTQMAPLLKDTTDLLRGYGNIVALSYSGRFEVLRQFMLEPRLGGFFWATKVTTTGLDDRLSTTHEGGGVTAGLTAAYRIWRGLEIGVSVDHFHGFPSNIATLYAGSLEWRFGD